ncbi:DEAD/DEAH box helicase [Caldifermentibacillus hisashii]|uniref:DEAD/DEAH box helicase n=1 Tax=Caldifermentibacillus hisashii TaxID=996558 RepID=UPI0031B72EA3
MANWTALQQMKPFLQENWEKSGFTDATLIQKQTVPLILAGKDVIAESPTGTGKTLAYIIPILERLNEDKKDIQAVILVPSRELAMQILDEVRKFTKGTEIVSYSFIGGANLKKQVEKLKSRPQIVIGTTGRMYELIKMKKMKMHEVRTVVIDEADRLLSQEHLAEVKNIIHSTLRDRQLLVFSATITKETEEIARDLMNHPEMIRIQTQPNDATIQHLYLTCEQREKIDLLRKIMHTNPGRTIAFFKNTVKVEEAAEKLTYHGLKLAVLTSEGNKMERKTALTQFRSGAAPLLLTTDVAARGLDIPDIATVIHVDFPSTEGQYLHRSGRTGRMGKTGTVISLVNAREESFLKKMSKELNVKISRKELYKGKMVDVKKNPHK